MMTTTAEAWAELQAAMSDTPPACAGDPTFTLDGLSNDELAECAEICASCPLLDLCSEYATVARPAAGFWAGKPRRGAVR